MSKHYVTFGQDHAHRVGGQTLDKDSVACFEADDASHGRSKAFDLFGPKFCMEYHDGEFDMESLKYFPRGIVTLNENQL